MAFDSSTFAAKDPQELRRKFAEGLAPVVARVCAKRLTDAEIRECVVQAGLSSGWGRFVMGHNYWMLPGRGDAGSFLIVRVRRDHRAVSGFQIGRAHV